MYIILEKTSWVGGNFLTSTINSSYGADEREFVPKEIWTSSSTALKRIFQKAKPSITSNNSEYSSEKSYKLWILHD